MLTAVALLLPSAAALLLPCSSPTQPSARCVSPAMQLAEPSRDLSPPFEAAPATGDAAAWRPLGPMEKLLNARRSWSGAMTTAHVSAAFLSGPPPSEAELLQALERAVERQPLLRAFVRGKGKFDIPDAEAYPLHSDYLGRAVAYNKELMRLYPDADVQRFAPSPLASAEIARRALRVSAPAEGKEVEAAGLGAFEEALDGLDVGVEAPLWRLTLIADAKGDESALVWAANHAVSDQLSHQQVLHEVLDDVARIRAGDDLAPVVPLPLPPSVEGALIGGVYGRGEAQHEEVDARLRRLFSKVRPSTLSYAAFQMGASGMAVVPNGAPVGDAATDAEGAPQRRTAALFARLSAEETTRLAASCKRRGQSVSGAICAATLLSTADYMGDDADFAAKKVAQAAEAEKAGEEPSETRRRYKLLQALNMRPFNLEQRTGGGSDWSGGSVVAGTGSMDLLLELSPGEGLARFWEIAAECNRQTRAWIDNGWARESLLLFGAGWEFMNMNRVVELGAQDRNTLGRAYSCATSNVGRFPHPNEYGDLRLQRIHFGISQSVSAPAISVSAVTVDGCLCLTTNYCVPIWTTEQAGGFVEGVCEALRLAADDE